MIDPVTLTLTAASAAVVGLGAGILARRNLDRVGYRQGDETSQPAPKPRRWVPWITEAAAASLTLAALGGPRPWLLLPLLPLAFTGAWLAAVDMDVYRIPNRVTGPVTAATIAAVVVVTAVTASLAVTILAMLGGVIAAIVFGASHLLTRGGIGMGDVKLAAAAGLAIGPLGLLPVIVALMAGSIIAIIWAKATHHTGPIAYGPWLLLGAWAATLIALCVPLA